MFSIYKQQQMYRFQIMVSINTDKLKNGLLIMLTVSLF